MKKRKSLSAASPKFNREALLNHDIQVTTDGAEKRFKAWARTFAGSVTEVLLTIDEEGDDCNPARDFYVRFGWDRRITESDILDWWESRLEWFIEAKFKESAKVYKAAIRDIKRAL